MQGGNNMTEPKIAVVTGAAGGVGGATVRLLVSDGWRVIATVRREEQVAQLNAIRG